MSRRRPTSAPPTLPGFTYDELIGTGGFSDVFRYRQHLPSRVVAVKVLLSSASDEDVRTQFVDEANLMAQLSAHPSIVTIHHADIASDHRPYLVMEYCPHPTLAARYKSERISVPESLRIGIRLAGAIETAHRAGILHRDVKPANVLTTEYGWPALTDFGISVAAQQVDDIAVGMSIPWAAPEFFDDDAQRGPGGDIYALAATIYTLLAGRSPFEKPGGSNSAVDLIARIQRDGLPRLDRPDAPAALGDVLSRAMAKQPHQRFPTAAEFGRSLQRIEQELQLAHTSLDLADTSQLAAQAEAGVRTRARQVQTISPQGPAASPAPAAPTRARPVNLIPADSAREARAPADRPATPASDAAAGPAQRRRWPAYLFSLVLICGVIVLAATGVLLTPEDDPDPQPTHHSATIDSDPTPDPPVELVSEPDEDMVEFTWQPPADHDGDYVWSQVGSDESDRTDQTSLRLPADSGTVCVEVAAVDDRGTLSKFVQECG